MSQPKVNIHRYEHPDQVGWTGYVEPDDRTWIVFFGPGRATFFGARDPNTGAVLDQPSAVASTSKP